MNDKTKMELVESYIFGNIGYVKSKVKRMSKSDFIDFIELCRGNGIKPYQLRNVV